jgi:cytochrome c biogenesis protein CcmG/thiol:disulfide interchange protein DsbE
MMSSAMNRWLQLAVLAVAAVVVAELILRDREPPAAPPRPGAAVRAPAAPELSLRGLDGKPVDLKDYRGKVVAVNFWATWCGPCVEEMPDLAELWRARHGSCFEVLGVAGMSNRHDTEKMARSIPYPVLFDEDGAAIDAWSVTSFPRTFVLDPEGRVRQVFRGMIDRKQLAQAVEPLLPSSCPGQSG